MKIANADKLKDHFENVVDVKLFTPAQIITIIDTFSSDVDENNLISRKLVSEALNDVYDDTLDGIVKFGIEKAAKAIDKVPPFFGGTKP